MTIAPRIGVVVAAPEGCSFGRWLSFVEHGSANKTVTPKLACDVDANRYADQSAAPRARSLRTLLKYTHPHHLIKRAIAAKLVVCSLSYFIARSNLR
ncbi:unnamed protein product, partial [Brenthis ino]